MEESITKLLAGLKKPARHFRQCTLRLTDKQFLELESYCTVRYLNYSDVMREALTEYMKNK